MDNTDFSTYVLQIEQIFMFLDPEFVLFPFGFVFIN